MMPTLAAEQYLQASLRLARYHLRVLQGTPQLAPFSPPTLKAPHPEQSRFIDSPRKRKVIRAGRRGGKTTGVAILAVTAFGQGKRVLYAVPTQDQADKFWYEVKTALSDAIQAGELVKNETRRLIERPGTEQRLRCKTAFNSDSLRGDYADLLILDEYQMMHESAWEQVGAPMLLDNDGDAVFIYTPPSRRTRHLSRADDPRHASKLYARAAAEQAAGGTRWAAFHFTSRDNPHISQDAVAELAGDMTQQSIRQEIDAEDVDDVPGALWTRKLLDDTRVTKIPDLIRITVGVDPTGSTGGDACGIVVCGKDATRNGYVLEDCTVHGSPATWAGRAVAAYHRWSANAIVAESNYGGDMVASTLESVPGAPHVQLVHASRGKLIRAEPIASLSEHGRFHMAGVFTDLEDELISYDGTGKSPNRLDAMVFAAVDLGIHYSAGHGLS